MRLAFFSALLLFSAACAAGEIVVISNPESGVEKLTRMQVIDIYTGREGDLPSGVTALPLDLAIDASERVTFYRRLLNKSVSEINAYWARLLFSGRATPPRQVKDSAAAIEAVAQNKGAIAYVDKSQVNANARVKVVLELAN